MTLNKQQFLALFTPLILIVPNVALNFTDHLPVMTSLVNIILPLGIYITVTTSFSRIGVTVWCLLPIMIFCGFQIVLLYLYGCSIIGVDMFLNVVTSNPDEISELLGNLIIAISSLVVIYIPFLVIATICICKGLMLKADFIKPWRNVGLAVTALGTVLLFLTYTVTPSFAVTNDIFPANVTKNLCLAFQRHAQIANYPETSARFTYNAISTHPDSIPEIYVYVIGETSRAQNWQLLGYDRDTNPELSKAENLTVFTRAITQSATTHKSVPMLLSPLTAEDFDSISNRKSIITAFREAGFYTSFLSNQRRNRSYTEYFGNEADTVVYLPDRASSQQYDGELITLLNALIANHSHPKQFIVLHTYGSHFNYSERYPRSFAHFKPDDKTDANASDRPQLINAYDNTIRYIDSYIKQAIDTLQASHITSALIYASDHGEDIFDDSRNRFLHASPVPTYYQLRVPFIVWLSNAYISQFPEKYETMQANSQAIVSPSISLYNTTIDLAGISTPYFNQSASVSSTNFNSPTLFYLSDRNEPILMDSTTLHRLDYNLLKNTINH